MASPFSVFRRHQKVSLAVLGVVVMIGFVVLPAIIQMQQYATGNSQNPVVLKWNGGQLTEAEMASRLHTRGSLLRFIQQLQEDARKVDPEVQLNTSIGIPNTDDPRSIVQTMLLAEKARQMGIVVSDQAISDYLTAITDGTLTPAQMVEAKKKALDTKWTEERLFNALREELLAQKLRQMGSTAVAVTTPAAAWEYHNRMEREVTAEFVPFAVDDYVGDVTSQPTSKEVQELYETYKADYPMPDSPDPGFKERPKAQFEYFVAVYDKYLQEEKQKVTREEIEKYYEENKNSFRIDEEPPDVEEEGADADDPRKATPMPPLPPSDEAAATDESTAPVAPAGEPGVQGEEGEAGEGSDTAAETPSAGEPVAEGGAALPPVKNEEDEEPESPESAATDDDLTAPPEKMPKFKPLVEVEEEIRRQLASEPAEKRLTAAIDGAKGELRQYRHAALLHETDPDNSPDPGKFDYKRVAKKLGLSSGETGLIDALDLYEDKDLELGQSYQFSEDFRGNFRPRRIAFAAVAFDESIKTYNPIETQLGGREKVFLSWKVDEKPARVPELSEIRDKVVAAWKRQEARKLARAAAEKLASEVSGEKPLQKQVGGNEKVLTPPAFTYFVPMSLWMFRLQGQQPQLEEIQGIEDASSDAIKKMVFALPVGGVDVVENAAKSAYYVVRVAREGNVDDQRRSFMQAIVDSPLDGPPPELRYIGYGDQVAVFQDWSEEIEKEFGAEWIDKEYLERTAGRN